MKKIVIVFATFFFLESFSQELPFSRIINFSSSASMMKIRTGQHNLDNKISGTFFLNKDWNNTTKIVTNNNKTYSLPNVNYDLRSNDFVVKLSKDSLFIVDKSKIKFIYFGTKYFELIDNKYYERLSTGKLSVLKKYYLTIRESPKDPMTKVKIHEDKYIIKSNHYREVQGKLEEITINKRSLFNLFEDSNKKAIKKFIKINSLNYKENDDLKQIFVFYNKL